MKSKLLSALALIVLFGCNKPSPEQIAKRQAEFDARRAEECRDKFCEGDVSPPRDIKTEAVLKVNNQFFIGPQEYFSAGINGATFYWPTKGPGFGTIDGYPKGADFSDVAIEIFLRSNPNPPPGMLPRYQALKEAEKEGRVLSKQILNAGLEVWEVREGLLLYLKYVATGLRDADGDPPILSCLATNAQPDFCTMALGWQPGISAALRFSGRHSKDWPSIYQEVIRVLSLLRKA